MTDTSVGLVPESSGPRARVIRVSVGGIDVDMQVVVAATVIGSDGTVLDIDSWVKSYNYNGDGTINYVQTTNGVDSWRQTWTWTTGQLTSLTAWVKQ